MSAEILDSIFGDKDYVQQNAFLEMVYNVLLSRREFLEDLMDPRRNVYEDCGLPDPGNEGIVNPELYRMLYDREAVAARVVEVLPEESWQVQPVVYEDEQYDVNTPFETAWRELPRTLDAEESFFEDPNANPIWDYLIRADKQSGIGCYGVLLLGLNDGADLSLPAFGGDSGSGGKSLTYLRVFPEHLAMVSQVENDPASPRRGLPTMYTISFYDPRYSTYTSAQVTGLVTVQVHWTRIIHIADGLGSSEYLAPPRMRPVVNNLLGLQKLYCGSPEMYWRGAFPGLSLETDPALGGKAGINIEATKNMMEQYMNGLQRYLALVGMTAKTLAPQVVDPTPQIDAQIKAICIKLGIPLRVFMGSERGELASSQDDAAWNDRLRNRQTNYLTPRIIVPFVNRLIRLGVLPKPKQFRVAWPDLTSQSDQEKANIAVSRTQALVQYVRGNIGKFIVPMDYLTRILGLKEHEALAMCKNAGIDGNKPMDMGSLGQGPKVSTLANPEVATADDPTEDNPHLAEPDEGNLGSDLPE